MFPSNWDSVSYLKKKRHNSAKMLCFIPAENGNLNPGSYHSSSAYSWVSSVTVCGGSDLAASGAGNGSVRLWAIESETKDIQPLYNLPLVSSHHL